MDLQYGYDKDGNVLYRQDNVNSAMSELYGYDGLSQLTSFERGTLNSTDTAITGTPSVSETWGYDALGNHLTDTTNGTTVTSTFNDDNQITAMSGSTTPAYDADGNMTTDQAASRPVKYTPRFSVLDCWPSSRPVGLGLAPGSDIGPRFETCASRFSNGTSSGVAGAG